MEVASAMRLDSDAVRRRAELAIEMGPGMPPEAVRWATVAIERMLQDALNAHVSLIPPDLLYLSTRDSEKTVALPEPWGDLDDWKPIESAADLDALLPPLER